MNNKLWIKLLIGFLILILGAVCLINYIVDPYGIYKTSYFPDKPKDSTQARLIKAVKLNELKPVSIVVGTSRADMGINPEHKYFEKPSYNTSLPGSSIYEIKFYIKNAIFNGNLKHILLVADWRMFNDNIKKVNELESYFKNFNPYGYLLNMKTLEDSYYTFNNQGQKSMYLPNGLLSDVHMGIYVKQSGGHLSLMNKDDNFYYSLFPKSNNIYIGTNRNSFDDFKEILKLCYENNIKLDIVFGPSHIRLWEAFSHYHDINIWYKWKKDVVLAVEEMANKENKTPYKVMDFSVYHELTAEKVPVDKDIEMKYHFESSHYKKELGNIVLDRLLDISPYKDFGVELNSQNIDAHIEKLKVDRVKFIDIEAYKKEVFGD